MPSHPFHMGPGVSGGRGGAGMDHVPFKRDRVPVRCHVNWWEGIPLNTPKRSLFTQYGPESKFASCCFCDFRGTAEVGLVGFVSNHVPFNTKSKHARIFWEIGKPM